MTTASRSTVVVGADGTDSARSAAEWAADQAVRRGDQLRIVHAFMPPAMAYPLVASDQFEAFGSSSGGARHMLEQTEKHLRQLHPDLAIHTLLRFGHPVTALREESAAASVTVVGSQGTPQFPAALLGPVAARLASSAHSPLVVIRDRIAPAPDGHGPIVVGADGSPDSDAAIGFGFEQANLMGQSLLAVRILRDSESTRSSSDDTGAERIAAETRELARQLTGWTEKFPDVNVETQVLTGHPAAVLLELSDPRTNEGRTTPLVVVGRRGRGGFPRLLLGSTTSALIDYAECPVAVVPTAN